MSNPISYNFIFCFSVSTIFMRSFFSSFLLAVYFFFLQSVLLFSIILHFYISFADISSGQFRTADFDTRTH